MNTLVDLLEVRAQERGDALAYIFLKSDESELMRLTVKKLREFARVYGSVFRKEIPAGERVLLVLPDEPQLYPVIWGCFYAGVVAVPSPAIDAHSTARMVPRLKAILSSSGSRYIVSNREVRGAILKSLGGESLGDVQWILVDEIKLDLEYSTPFVKESIHSEDVAILQFTSGSTSAPKGIQITHGNILHNLETIDVAITRYIPSYENRVSVCWLPYFHDMGLIGHVLSVIYGKTTLVVLKPIDFLKRPVRWLRAISKYKGGIVMAPNFAFELCRKKVSDEDLKDLDLSSLRCAVSGGETVRWETMTGFAEKFGTCGYEIESFAPALGMAENTLFVSSSFPGELRYQTVSLESLQRRKPKFVPDFSPQSLRVVSCGKAVGHDVRIVDPETGEEVPAGEIGEVWISGGSVAHGYWGMPEDSERTFGAQLLNGDGKKFLRTGDLGFLTEDRFYFSGRIKDIVIVNGKNHFPQDIELTAERSHASIRPGCLAAFSVEEETETSVVLVVEAKLPPSSPEIQKVREAIVQAVALNHGLSISEVVVILPGTSMKTSSGKIQRQFTKSLWMQKRLIRLDSHYFVRLWAKMRLMRVLNKSTAR